MLPNAQRRYEDRAAHRRGRPTGAGDNDGDQARNGQDFATYTPMFQKHYATAFAGTGAAYAEYEPAYRYGYELRHDERYRGRDWAALEADARRDWERHPNTWERFKDAIRYGWDNLTGVGAERSHGPWRGGISPPIVMISGSTMSRHLATGCGLYRSMSRRTAMATSTTSATGVGLGRTRSRRPP